MKIRNKNENAHYADYLETAMDQVQQAIDNITYLAYPELNKRTIAKLQEILDSIDRVSAAPIFKPN